MRCVLQSEIGKIWGKCKKTKAMRGSIAFSELFMGKKVFQVLLAPYSKVPYGPIGSFKKRTQDSKSLEIISYEEWLKLKIINQSRLSIPAQIRLRVIDKPSVAFGLP